MNLRRLTALLLTLLACFCSKPEKLAPPRKNTIQAVFNAPPPDDAEERSNLANMTAGAAIASRTGEMNLALSAASLIDGDPASAWLTPPGDPEQSVVIALPAMTAIEKLGIQTTTLERQAAKTVVVDISRDGTTFIRAGSIDLTPVNEIQWMKTTPQQAAFVRITTGDTNAPLLQVNSVVVKGTLGDLKPRRISGCWKINGKSARFEQHGAHITGVIEDRDPYFLEGGSNGRLIRLNWIKGPQFGSAAITLTPDSETLSGLKWHEVPVSEFFGEAWFGERAPCTSGTLIRGDVVRRFLKKPGSLPLYGLIFDEKGNLDVLASERALRQLIPLLTEPVKLVARDFREKTEAENLAISKTEIESLKSELEKRRVDLANVTFEAAGTTTKRVKPVIQLTRELYSAVELER